MTDSMQFADLRVTDILDFAAENHGDTDVISYLGDGGRISHAYAALHGRVRQVAGALTRLGLAHGDRIATLAWNHHRHFELYYAIPGFGAVIHTVNPRVSPEQIAYMIDVADDRALLFDSDLAPLVERIQAQLTASPLLIELTDAEPSLPGAISYESILADAKADFDWVEGSENEPCGLCFTSGTTGNPKGVQYTHRSTVLHAMACCMSEGQAISSSETILPAVPMFHANAWGIPHSAPMAGAKLVMPGNRLDGGSLLRLVRDEDVSFLCGVPTIWQSVIDAAAAAGQTLAPLRRAGIGGAAPSRAMIERLEQYGAEVFHAWGMTETNPFGGTGFLKGRDKALPPDLQIDLKLAQGRSIFGLRRKIVDEEGRSLPCDGSTSGRLMVQGNWVVNRYINEPSSALNDSWFDTGDVATINPDGYMRIVDRLKDLIKSGGEWISSIALESIAHEVHAVLHVAALGRPDPKWGERPVLAISVRPDMTLTEGEVLAAFAGRLPKWQVPDAAIFLDSLPMTATGKVDKRSLRVMLWGAVHDRA